MCEFYDYYNPSECEVLFEEFKEKFKEILKDDIEQELSKLTRENLELRKITNEYKDKKEELKRKERELSYKEKNLKSIVEGEFYQKTMDEVFERLLEDSEVWYAESVPHEKPKCDLCNEKRQMVAKYPNGKTVNMACDCAKRIYVYEPMLSLNREIKFHKAFNPRYNSKKKVYFTESHSPNSNYAEAYDYYSKFRIERIYDDFNEDVKSYHKEKIYNEKIAFRNKEACQKYCDWLNEQK